MALDVVHQEADSGKADDKGHDAAHQQHSDLGTGDGYAGDRELNHLEQGCTCHDRDGQIEGELCHAGAGEPQQQTAHDGSAGAGGAGDDGKALPHADEQRVPVADLFQLCDPGCGAAVLHHEEEHTVQNQHGGYGDVVVEVCLHPIVQRADDQHRQGGGYHLEPQVPHAGLGDDLALPQPEGPQLIPEQHHHGQNGTQLDDHPEHGHEFFTGIELDDLFHQNHVTGGGDGQPLGNALHDTHQDRFDDLEKRNKSLLQHPVGCVVFSKAVPVYHTMSRCAYRL